MPENWREKAACKGQEHELFWPINESATNPSTLRHIAKAKAVCARCPVRAACLMDALFETQGIRGGCTGPEREKFVRTWRRKGYPQQPPEVVAALAAVEVAS